MKEFEALGSFWFPGHKTISVHGRLKFDSDDGGRLELSSELGELMPNGETRVTWGLNKRLIHGETNLDGAKVAVTLLDCFSSAASDWVVNAILAGDHFGDEQEATFDEVIFGIDSLTLWSGGLHIWAIGERSERQTPSSVFEIPPEQTSSFAAGSVSLCHRWRSKAWPDRIEVAAWAEFKLAFTELTSLREASDTAASIYNLVALCTQNGPRFQSIDLYSTNRTEVSFTGEAIPGTKKKISLFARLDTFAGRRKREPKAADIVVGYDDLGGIEAISRWIDLHKAIPAVVGSMLTIRGQMYAENMFLNQVSAAESLHRLTVGGQYMPSSTFKSMRRKIRRAVIPMRHRVWFNELMGHANDPSLACRLRELAKEIPTVVTAIIGEDIEPWIQVVKRIRNFGTHLGSSPIGDGADLLWLSESVFDLTRMAILFRLGVPLGTLEKIANKPSVQFTAERSAEVVGRLISESKVQ